MTTDFLLTVRQPNGNFKSVARKIKYQQDLNSLRTLEKLEIERRFWMSQGVDWAIVTKEFFTPDSIKNLGLLRRYAQFPRTLTIWRKVILIDLGNAPLHLKSLLPGFKVIYSSAPSALNERSL